MTKSMADRARTCLWEQTSAMWEFIAFSLRYPEAELAAMLVSGEWEASAREISEAANIPLPAPWPQGLPEAGDLAEDVLRNLRVESTRLFVGAPHAVVSPYECVQRAYDDEVEPLTFLSPRAIEVERFCASCGLGRPRGTNEPLDHVATECELLQYLASLVASADDSPAATELPAERAQVTFPGGTSEAAYTIFLEEHAHAWMPRFSKAVETETREPFYRAAAQLLQAMLAWRP